MAFISERNGKYIVRYDNPKPEFIKDEKTGEMKKREVNSRDPFRQKPKRSSFYWKWS